MILSVGLELAGLAGATMERIPSEASVPDRASREASESLAGKPEVSNGNTTLTWTLRNSSDKYSENSPGPGLA